MKKMVSIILNLVFIIMCFPFSINGLAVVVECPECNTEFDNGFCDCVDGYEAAKFNSSGYYELSNAGNLFWFAQQVNDSNTNLNAILINDIDLNEGYTFAEDGTVLFNGEIVTEGWRIWTPIGNSTNKYDGIFDGNGKTVSGVYYNGEIFDHYGLFGVSSENSEIKNIELKHSYIYTSNSQNYSSGVIIGLNYGKIAACGSSSCIFGSHYTGGVVGTNQENGIVFDCYNTGKVTASTIKYAKYAGGVVANNFGMVEKCHNTGDVYAYSGYCAGVVGYNNYGVVSFCYNEGTATATNNGKNAGVVGYNYFGEVYQCFNEGTITMQVASGTAGVVAINEQGSVSYCYNNGEINGYDTTGGVVGANDKGSELKICFNTGTVKGLHTITGGVSGSNKMGSIISDCYNWGDVYSSIASTGGITSNNQGYYKYTDTPAAQIINCYNIGNVSNGDNREYGQIYGNSTAPIKGDVINCYYLSDSESKSETQFNSGEVTTLLNDGASSENCIWGQEIGVDPYPVFNKNIVFYNGTNYYEMKTILSPMSSQIRFTRNDDGLYSNMFDIRTRAEISDADFKLFIAGSNDEAKKKISKVGFVYSRSSENFSTEDARKVAQGENINGYTDAPVSYIQDADGYYMFTCLVTGIPIEDVNENLTAYAYICVDNMWYFFDAKVTADFNYMHTKYYPQAAEKYGW